MQTPGKGQFQAGIPIAQAAGVNVAANNPVTAAVGNAANAVQNAGNLADDLQSEQERQYLAEAELAMGRKMTDLQLTLKTRDPAGHVDYAESAFDAMKADILGNEHYSPRVQKMLGNSLNVATARALDQIKLNSGLQQIENGKALHLALVDRDLENRDFAAARARKAESVLYLGETGNKLQELRFEKMEAMQKKSDAYDAAVRRIDSDPIAELERLETPDSIAAPDPDLDPEDMQRLRRYAEPLANRSKAELWEAVLNASLDGNVISQDEVRGLSEEGTISPQQRAAYIATYHQPTKPAFDATVYEDAFSVISRHDPAKDPTGATLAQLRGQLGTLPLPPESLKELSKRLTDRATPPKPEAKKRHRLEGDFQSRTDRHFEDGKFGNWFKWDVPRDAGGNPIPGKEQTKVIQASDWSKALTTKRRFLDQWDAYLENSPEGIDPAEAEKVYQSIFEKVVLDSDETLPTGGTVPPAPPAVEFNDIDGLLGTPGETPATSRLPDQSSTFGGIPILPPGRFYQNAMPTVFGGTNDPEDNGKSAFGGTTGAGGREGVAIPHDVLKATFPGKSKAWFEKNVRVAVRTADGRKAVMPIADLGTAELVWKKNGKPTLDLTPGAVKQLGGSVIYDGAGKMTGVRGIGNLSFALTTQNAGAEADLSRMTWEDASAAWFKDKRPTAPEQIASGLAALRHAWNSAQLQTPGPGQDITANNLQIAAEAAAQ